MNCKPGDLAFIVVVPPHAPQLLGAIVSVLSAAHAGVCDLPDGGASSSEGQSWVVEFPRPIAAPLAPDGKRTRMTRYGVISDHALRPIRGDEQPQEIIRELEAV